MNRAALLPSEMLHCTDMMTVLERQRSRLKWQQEQQQPQQQQLPVQEGSYFSDLSGVFHQVTQQGGFQGGLGEMVTRLVKPDPCLVDNVWTGAAHDVVAGFDPCGYGNGTTRFGFDINNIDRTSSCPATVAAALAAAGGKESDGSDESKMSSGVGRESFKKRKADKVVAEDDTRDKRIKGSAEEGGDSKIMDRNNNKSCSSSCQNSNNNNNANNKNIKSCTETSAENSKDNSKVTEVPKTDYIHVRARRGQATDSHSLAERVRREKISERMKYLQDLVPGCNKITGKAGMLDEIINYVQSLQRQVEFLSMKLASVNPRLDFNVDNLIAKEFFSACPTNFPTIGMSSDMTSPAYLQLNSVQQQLFTCCGLDMDINPSDMGLRRTISAPIADTFLDSSCFTQLQPPSTWDADLQNLCNVGFDQGRSTSFPPQAFTSSIEASNLKMEM